MGETGLYRRVISGRDAWSLPLRAVLRLASGCYGAAVARRNRSYDRGIGCVSVEVPVISVGNVTAGGTGKTPLVIKVAHLLEQRGRRVAVLSRGYKASPGRPADELVLISRRLPGTACLGDPDRAGAARRVIDRQGIDAIVLDDAFQHRRLARDLDIVTVDATCPFGYGHLLPRGLLREPPAALGRAGLIVVTRADQVPDRELHTLHNRLAELAPQVRWADARHRPTGLIELDGSRADPDPDLAAGAFCFSAIGNPAAFEHTVRALGADLRGRLRWPDHHCYAPADLHRLARQARSCGAKLLVTTEKDAVKLAALPFDWPGRVVALRIDVDFLDDGVTILAAALDQIL
jgi:tetraacyldisaccharide 4'-kinase